MSVRQVVSCPDYCKKKNPGARLSGRSHLGPNFFLQKEHAHEHFVLIILHIELIYKRVSWTTPERLAITGQTSFLY